MKTEDIKTWAQHQRKDGHWKSKDACMKSEIEELRAALAERDAKLAALEDWRSAVAMAYGHLWHINNEPMAPIPLRSEESAYYAARKLLRDLLTTEERGEAINSVRAMLTASPKDPINGMVSSATSNALTGKLFSAVISRRK